MVLLMSSLLQTTDGIVLNLSEPKHPQSPPECHHSSFLMVITSIMRGAKLCYDDNNIVTTTDEDDDDEGDC